MRAWKINNLYSFYVFEAEGGNSIYKDPVNLQELPTSIKQTLFGFCLQVNPTAEVKTDNITLANGNVISVQCSGLVSVNFGSSGTGQLVRYVLILTANNHVPVVNTSIVQIELPYTLSNGFPRAWDLDIAVSVDNEGYTLIVPCAGNATGSLKWQIGTVTNPIYRSNKQVYWRSQQGREYYDVTWDLFFSDIPEIDLKNPYQEGGTSDTGGGDGNFDDSSDQITIPETYPDFNIPTKSSVEIWAPTPQQLGNFFQYLWSSDFFDVLLKLFNDPMESLYSLHALPVSVGATISTLKIGNVDTGITFNKANSKFVTVDCGSLNLSEYYGSALDYTPYTKISLFLPYIGVVSLNTDNIQKKSIRIVYRIDILTGDFVCLIQANTSLLYHYEGNCAARYPLSNTDYSNTIKSLISSGTSIAAAVASGGMSAPLQIAMAGQMASNVMNGKPIVKHSGQVGGIKGFLDVQKPHFIIERAKQSVPKKIQQFQGFPSNITAQLSTLQGYTQVEKIHLENIPATDSELTMIDKLLKEGVII